MTLWISRLLILGTHFLISRLDVLVRNEMQPSLRYASLLPGASCMNNESRDS